MVVARSRSAKARTTSQKARPLNTGIVTKVAMMPITPMSRAIHQVMSLGADICIRYRFDNRDGPMTYVHYIGWGLPITSPRIARYGVGPPIQLAMAR